MVVSSIRNKRSQKFSLTLILFILIMVSLACSTSGSGSESAPATQPPQVVDQNAQATQVAKQVQETLAAAQAEATEPPVEVTEEPVATSEVSTSEIPGVEVNEAASEPGDYYYKTEIDAVDDWSYYLVKGKEEGFAQESSDSRFRIEILKPETYLLFINETYTYEDVQLDTSVENLGQNQNFTGLICRFNEDDETWYGAHVLNTGEYFLYQHDENGFNLMFSGASTEIKMGKEINEYTFVCKGEELTLGINGVEVKKITTKTQGFRPLREGKVGIFVASTDVYPLLVEFDWFTASVPY